MLHQVCGNIVYATKSDVKYQRKQIINDIDEHITSWFNSLLNMRNKWSFSIDLSFHLEVPTFGNACNQK